MLIVCSQKIKKYLFNYFSERSIIFIEGKETPSPTVKGRYKMKMNTRDFADIVKNQCEQIVNVLERHAKENTSKDAMHESRAVADGKLSGIIDMTISVYARELGHDEYWEKVDEIRAYKSEIEDRISKIYLSWYKEYLNNNERK